MAVEMIDEVLERGKRPDVRSLAERMKAAQLEEIAQLQAIRAELTGQPESSPMADPHAKRELAQIQMLSGNELDITFMLHMMAHHALAIVIAHQAYAHLQHPGLPPIAAKTFNDQAREIGSLRARLRTFPFPGEEAESASASP